MAAKTLNEPTNRKPRATSKSSSSIVREKMASARAANAARPIDPALISLAHTKPDWSKQVDRPLRKLWEIAALACNVDPQVKVISATRKLDSAWAMIYHTRLSEMCDALSSDFGDDFIHFDRAREVNVVHTKDSSKLRLLRVDAKSAVAFVLRRYGMESLPPQFRDLHARLTPSTLPAPPLARSDEADPTNAPQKKSQEKAIETKTSTVLSALLYILVERELGGWADANDLQKKQILDKILKYVDSHEIRSRYGLGLEAIEAAIDRGMHIAPRI